MTQLASPLKTTRAAEHALSALSPFELKDYLIKLAKSNEQQSTAMMLNAGRAIPTGSPRRLARDFSFSASLHSRKAGAFATRASSLGRRTGPASATVSSRSS